MCSKILRCPCSLFTGIKRLLTDREILHYGIGFVIGISFGSVILSLVNNILMPLIFSSVYLFSNVPIVTSGYGWISINYNVNNTILTLLDARNHDSFIIEYNIFISSVIYFIIVLIATYLLTSIFIDFEVKEKCQYCLIEKPKEARRCHNCTTWV